MTESIAAQYTEGGGTIGTIQEFLNRKRPKLKYWKHLLPRERRDWYHGFLTRIEAKRIPFLDNDDIGKEFIDLKEEERRISVCAVEIANELFKVDNPVKEQKTLREINEILSNLDDWQKVNFKTIEGYNQQRTAFERKLPLADD